VTPGVNTEFIGKTFSHRFQIPIERIVHPISNSNSRNARVRSCFTNQLGGWVSTDKRAYGR